MDIRIIVADIQRSVAFYRHVLGAEVLREGEPTFLKFGDGYQALLRTVVFAGREFHHRA